MSLIPSPSGGTCTPPPGTWTTVLKSTKVERHKNSVVLSHKNFKVVNAMMLKIKTSTEEDLFKFHAKTCMGRQLR